MKNTNKPQWLIDAENEIQKFEESKYGKISQSTMNSLIPLLNQSFESRSVNAKATYYKKTDEEKQKLKEYFKAYKTSKTQKYASQFGVAKNRELGNYKKFQENATKRASVVNSNNRHDRMIEVINALPLNIEFGFEEFTIIAEKFNRKWWYIKELHRFYPEIIIKTGRGKYKKVV